MAREFRDAVVHIARGKNMDDKVTTMARDVTLKHMMNTVQSHYPEAVYVGAKDNHFYFNAAPDGLKGVVTRGSFYSYEDFEIGYKFELNIGGSQLEATVIRTEEVYPYKGQYCILYNIN